MRNLLIILTLLMVLAQLPNIHVWLTWDANAIISGQIWRIISGNFTHSNIPHLFMNLIGLWLIVFLFNNKLVIGNKQDKNIISQHVLTTLIIPTIIFSFIIGILLFTTSIKLYVGFSGVLHGLFAFYSLNEYLNGKKSSLLLVIGIITKIIYEQYFGSVTSSQNLINMEIATQAHLFGGATGLIWAVLNKFINKNPNQE